MPSIGNGTKRILERASELADRAAVRPWGGYAIAILFVATNVERALASHFVSEDGLDAWLSAQMVAKDLVPALFFVETRAPLALLFAPVALLGHTAFALANVVVCASALPLLSALARKLGHTRPNLAALALALSPTFYAAGSAAPRGSIIAVGMVLAAYLALVRGRAALAGLLAGALVLARVDAVILVAGVLFALPRDARVRAIVVAALAPIVLYGVAFVAYHGGVDVGLRALASFVRVPSGSLASELTGIEGLVDILLALGPVLFLVPLARRDALAPAEWALALSGGAFVLVAWHLPLVGGPPVTPSDLLPALPWLALVGARGIDAMLDGPARAHASVYAVVLLVAAEVVLLHRGSPLLLLPALFVGATVAAAHTGHRALPAVLVIAALLFSTVAFTSKSGLAASKRTRGLSEVVAMFAERPELHGRTVVTNIPLFALGVAKDRTLDVRSVRTPERREQIEARTSDGQREAILGLLEEHYAGRPIEGEELARASSEPEVIFVTRDDAWQRALFSSVPAPRFAPLLSGEIRVDEVRRAEP